MNQKQMGISRAGILLLIGVLFLWVPAFAQSASEMEGGADNAIKIYVDGVLLMPGDDSPQSTEPLLYEGTVYLPIWALSKALGKPVEWDSTTNSVHIGEPAEIAEIKVSTAEELISALGSNRRILLEEGVYNLTQADPGYVSANVYSNEKPDGPELFLDGLHNLTIQGIGDEPSEIIVEPRYANVLNFQNCSNISIVNIKAGHTESGQCAGGVFWFDNCTGIQIEDTDMYGCGTVGLIFYQVTNVRVTGSTIYECTAGIMNIVKSSDILFTDCVFRDNETSYLMVSAEQTSNLAFDACSFLRNTNAAAMFYLSGYENITVKNTEFIDNIAQMLVMEGELDMGDSCQFENNLFVDAR